MNGIAVVVFAEVAQTGTARAWKARGASAPQEFKSPPRRSNFRCNRSIITEKYL